MNDNIPNLSRATARELRRKSKEFLSTNDFFVNQLKIVEQSTNASEANEDFDDSFSDISCSSKDIGIKSSSKFKEDRPDKSLINFKEGENKKLKKKVNFKNNFIEVVEIESYKQHNFNLRRNKSLYSNNCNCILI